MEEKVFDFISATFGASVAIVVVVLLLAFWLVYYITHRVTCIQKDHSILEKSTQKTESHIDEIRRDLSYIKGSIDIVKSGAPTLMQSHSPISLTDIGREVAKELEADILIGRNWDKISTSLLNVKDKSAYDIQEYCIETASVEPDLFFDAHTQHFIKDFAFKKGMPIQLYLRLLGVIIRDRYFEEKGINVTEVDEYDQNIK